MQFNDRTHSRFGMRTAIALRGKPGRQLERTILPALRPRQHGIRLRIVHETLGLRIPRQRPLELHGDPAEDAGGVAPVRNRRRCERRRT